MICLADHYIKPLNAHHFLLASTALTLISHGNSLAFLQPDIESSYLEILVTATKKGPL